jgi:hypothetical protein
VRRKAAIGTSKEEAGGSEESVATIEVEFANEDEVETVGAVLFEDVDSLILSSRMQPPLRDGLRPCATSSIGTCRKKTGLSRQERRRSSTKLETAFTSYASIMWHHGGAIENSTLSWLPSRSGCERSTGYVPRKAFL